MLKITIILWILTGVCKIVVKLMGNGMSGLEKLDAQLNHVLPNRIWILTALYVLLFIAAIVCTILTVIGW